YRRVTQCRVGHAFIGKYYTQFNIPEPVDCPCGAGYQTSKHILTECPCYEDHHHYLYGVSPGLSLPVILGIMTKGIDALSSFFMESGAFTKTGELRGGPRELPRYEEEPDVDLSDGDLEDED
ncbi:hypothetical protein JAAARDRAFT_143445, partial [Jaapia argillacea MUCL 33604]